MFLNHILVLCVKLHASNVFKRFQTSGNALKLVKHRSRRDIRKYSFTNRIVDLWNSLPNHIVEAKTMFQFENRLDRHWEKHPIKYDFTAEYGPTTGRLGAVKNYEEELPIEPR